MLKAVKASVRRMTNHFQLIGSYLEVRTTPRQWG